MNNTEGWSFKYEPTEFKNLIVNDDIRKQLAEIMIKLPNMLLYGPPGIGKGTFTHILLKQRKLDHIWINASEETGIDVIRTRVKQFATSMSMGDDPKIVVLNEADSLSGGSAGGAQKMLRQLMEDVHKITRFIFLANYENLIIPELKSRCEQGMVKFDKPPAKDIYLYCIKILKNEKIKYKQKTVVNIIKKCYPDIRKTILSLSRNISGMTLNSDSINTSDKIYNLILTSVLKCDIESIRKHLRSNYIDYTQLYSYLFDNVGSFKSPGDAIIEIGDHLRWDSSVAIKEINFMHMVVKMKKTGVV